MRSRILVVSREVTLRAHLARILKAAGHTPELAESPAHARRIGCKGIALAIVVPDGLGPEGETLIGELKCSLGTTLVLSTAAGHATGPDMLGAADEAGLLSRISDAMRPVSESEQADPALQFAQYRLDPDGRSLVDSSGEEVALSRSEFDLLLTFVQRPGRVLSRDFLLQALAGRDAEAFDRSIDMLIVRLRRKIEPDPKHPSLIVTVPGSGYKFAASVQPAAAGGAAGQATAPPTADAITLPPPSPHRNRRAWMAAVAAAVVALVVVTVSTLPRQPPPPAVAPAGATQDAQLPLPEKPSIAVLPFAAIGGDAREQRLADGITEDVISDLSRYRDFFVIARNSVFTYKGKAVSAKQVGRELGVRYVLEGSIQTNGDRVRVMAQMIDAASNVHVWSEQYDRALGDIFDVQGEITQNIAASLGGNTGAITTADTEAARRKPPANLQAYDFALLGAQMMLRRTEVDNYKAEELFNNSIHLDPEFARVYGNLAVLYDMRLNQGWGRDSPAVLLEKARDYNLKAIALDPTDGIFYARLGQVYFEQNDFERGLAAFERALALNPNDPNILMYFGEQLAFIGRGKEGSELIRRAFRLNPRHPDWYNYQVDPFYATGQYDVAVARLLRAERSRPIWTSIVLALCYGQLGREADTAQAVATLLHRYPNFSMERALSDFGAINDPATLAHYLDGVRKAGLRECASEAELQAHPKMTRLAVCEARRSAPLQADLPAAARRQ